MSTKLKPITTMEDVLSLAMQSKLAMDRIIIEANKPIKFVAKLSDYEMGNSGEYMDGNGDLISKEEAQAEVDWHNGKTD